jgi:hypothetical protein
MPPPGTKDFATLHVQFDRGQNHTTKQPADQRNYRESNHAPLGAYSECDETTRRAKESKTVGESIGVQVTR